GINKVETHTVTNVTVKPDPRHKRLETEKRTERFNIVDKTDPELGNITIIESEEASRYTPSSVNYEIDNIDNSAVQITATSKKDDRPVKSTIVTTKPNLSKEAEKLSLQENFIIYQKTKDEDKRLSVRELVSLAKHLNESTENEGRKPIPTGAPERRKLETRIKKELERKGVDFTQPASKPKTEDKTVSKKNTSDQPKQGKQVKQPKEPKQKQNLTMDVIKQTKQELFKRTYPNRKVSRTIITPLPDLYKELNKKGYSNTQIDNKIKELVKKEKIELQIASDKKLLTQKNITFLENRGYVKKDNKKLTGNRGNLYFNYVVNRE
ncbi:MAG: hypothetical protein ACE5ES_05145, partial [Candidatus Nanoarchaeia archaeon]